MIRLFILAIISLILNNNNASSSSDNRRRKVESLLRQYQSDLTLGTTAFKHNFNSYETFTTLQRVK